MTITETELAYAAGLFDGEGSIMLRTRPGGRATPGRVRKRYHDLVVSLSSTDEVIIAWLQERWPGDLQLTNMRKPQHKQAYLWRINAARAEAFLTDVRPYLIIKAARADLALAFRATVGDKTIPLTADVELLRESLRQEMMRLNKRGR